MLKLSEMIFIVLISCCFVGYANACVPYFTSLDFTCKSKIFDKHKDGKMCVDNNYQMPGHIAAYGDFCTRGYPGKAYCYKRCIEKCGNSFVMTSINCPGPTPKNGGKIVEDVYFNCECLYTNRPKCDVGIVPWKDAEDLFFSKCTENTCPGSTTKTTESASSSTLTSLLVSTSSIAKTQPTETPTTKTETKSSAVTTTHQPTPYPSSATKVTTVPTSTMERKTVQPSLSSTTTTTGTKLTTVERSISTPLPLSSPTSINPVVECSTYEGGNFSISDIGCRAKLLWTIGLSITRLEGITYSDYVNVYGYEEPRMSKDYGNPNGTIVHLEPNCDASAGPNFLITFLCSQYCEFSSCPSFQTGLRSRPNVYPFTKISCEKTGWACEDTINCACTDTTNNTCNEK